MKVVKANSFFTFNVFMIVVVAVFIGCTYFLFVCVKSLKGVLAFHIVFNLCIYCNNYFR